ncbi:hypothetical protein GGR50DRAFT_691656 [Xylaria sp. CBS 124048]|nr:hypothetical protein GGR50DRAFT_691656 [Xylaria sp. CBS 124048]
MASEYLVVAGNLTGPKPLGFWTWRGAALVAPEGADNAGEDDDGELAPQFNDPLKRTAYIMDTLREYPNGGVRDIIEEHPRLQRLVGLKPRRDGKGNLMPVPISIKKSQQVNALAAHICLPEINLRPCSNCVAIKGNGPFDRCVAFGGDYFRENEEAAAFDAEREKAEAEANLPHVDREMLETAPLQYVERIRDISKFEMDRRADVALANITPSKKQRTT